MANIGFATLSIIPSLKGFNSKLRVGMGGALTTEGANAGQKAGRSFASTFAKAAAVGAAAAGAVALGKSFVDAAVESQKVGKQTEAVIKSMGLAGQFSAKGIGDLSTKLSMQSGIDDEVIQSAENVLLTFGKVRNQVGKGNDIFNRASQAALDMSVALGTDLQGATIQVGKALNDPIKGITALSRAGVSFTEKQKDTIKSLVAGGKTLEAQKLIMSELEKQFGGSAAAQATAGERLKVVIGNLQEQIGGYLLPAVEAVAGFLADNLPAALSAVGKVLGPVGKQIQAFFHSLTSGFTEDEGTPVERFALRLRAIGQQVVAWFQRNWPQIKEIATSVGEALVKVGGKIIEVLVKIGTWVAKNKPVLIGLGVAIATGLVAAFVSWAIAAGTAAVATIAAAAPVIAIGAAIAALVAGLIWAYQNWGWFKTAVDAAAGAIKAIAGFFVDTLLPAVGNVIGFITDHWRGLLQILTGPFGLAITFIVDHFGSIVDTVKGVVKTLTDIGSTMWDFVTAGVSGAVNAALSVLEGLINGVIMAINVAIRAYNLLPFHDDVDTLGHVSLGKTTKGIGSRGDVEGIRLAQGAIIKHRPGGIPATVGEGRWDEAVIPLKPGMAPLGVQHLGDGREIVAQGDVYLDGRRVGVMRRKDDRVNGRAA